MQNIHTIRNVVLNDSCMPNMASIISSNNKKKLGESSNDVTLSKECDCSTGKVCPLQGKCLQSDIIYQAKVTSAKETQYYIGLTADTFKSRYNQHSSNFTNKKYCNKTKLSAYIWKLKNANISYDISWEVVSKSKSYSPGSQSCNLCIREILFILFKSDMATSNSRSEMMGSCCIMTNLNFTIHDNI